MSRRAIMVILAACLALAACERERRSFDAPASSASAPQLRQSAIQPGQAMGTAAPGAPVMPQTAYTAEGNAYAVSQGKRLYRWFNCSGCHGAGGGGDSGPPLSDDEWRYGSAPVNVFRSIVEGRPGGMPSFGGHIAEDQVWQLVAYVRSLSGQLRRDVAPGRSDTLQSAPPEQSRDQAAPHRVNPMTGMQR
jgi:cytochrome c oxidase cbb3-type subunit 3